MRFVKFASAKDAVLSLTDGVDAVDRNAILNCTVFTQYVMQHRWD